MNFFAFYLKQRRLDLIPERIWRELLANEVFRRYIKGKATCTPSFDCLPRSPKQP